MCGMLHFPVAYLVIYIQSMNNQWSTSLADSRPTCRQVITNTQPPHNIPPFCILGYRVVLGRTDKTFFSPHSQVPPILYKLVFTVPAWKRKTVFFPAGSEKSSHFIFTLFRSCWKEYSLVFLSWYSELYRMAVAWEWDKIYKVTVRPALFWLAIRDRWGHFEQF